jgi:hypothetical protein
LTFRHFELLTGYGYDCEHDGKILL